MASWSHQVDECHAHPTSPESWGPGNGADIIPIRKSKLSRGPFLSDSTSVCWDWGNSWLFILGAASARCSLGELLRLVWGVTAKAQQRRMAVIPSDP